MRRAPLLAAALMMAWPWPRSVAAIDVGRPSAHATLGTPLSARIPLHLDAGDTLAEDCVRVEVMQGERVLPAHQILWSLEPGALPGDLSLRLSTRVTIDEPVIGLQLWVGCERRQLRRLTLLADPPAAVPAPPALAQVDAEPVTTTISAAPSAPAPVAVAVTAALNAAVAVGEAAQPTFGASPPQRSRAAARQAARQAATPEARRQALSRPTMALSNTGPATQAARSATAHGAARTQVDAPRSAASRSVPRQAAQARLTLVPTAPASGATLVDEVLLAAAPAASVAAAATPAPMAAAATPAPMAAAATPAPMAAAATPAPMAAVATPAPMAATPALTSATTASGAVADAASAAASSSTMAISPAATQAAMRPAIAATKSPGAAITPARTPRVTPEHPLRHTLLGMAWGVAGLLAALVAAQEWLIWRARRRALAGDRFSQAGPQTDSAMFAADSVLSDALAQPSIQTARPAPPSIHAVRRAVQAGVPAGLAPSGPPASRRSSAGREPAPAHAADELDLDLGLDAPALMPPEPPPEPVLLLDAFDGADGHAPAAWSEATAPMGMDEAAWAAGGAARVVSVQDLRDLEQQADFFIALGQDDSAIDLLMGHIRASGGASPMTYLKLLDIHRRRGEPDAYERTRERFNQRFNAHALSWSEGEAEHEAPGEGALERHEQVVNRLQRLWATPAQALVEIESWLFRRSDGPVFDLPAYRDLLALHGIARELQAVQGGAALPVDLALPLDDEAVRDARRAGRRGALHDALAQAAASPRSPMLRPPRSDTMAMPLPVEIDR